MDTIKRIAYYGYGYKEHQDLKWYAITQYLIWQETVENGEIYFTDKLNGKKISIFQNEINELYNLVNESKKKPSFINKKHIMIENKNLVLTDTNNVINQYNINNQKINNNELQISNLNEGNHNITLSKQYNNNSQPIIFYQSPNSQTLMKTGNLDTETINLEIQVIKTNIKIYKIDSENKNIYPQGESSLNNAIFGLYDENMNLLNQYKIINNIINMVYHLLFGPKLLIIIIKITNSFSF